MLGVTFITTQTALRRQIGRTVNVVTVWKHSFSTAGSKPFDVKFPVKNHPFYDQGSEKDACGVGFIADLTRTPTKKTVDDAVRVRSVIL